MDRATWLAVVLDVVPFALVRGERAEICGGDVVTELEPSGRAVVWTNGQTWRDLDDLGLRSRLAQLFPPKSVHKALTD